MMIRLLQTVLLFFSATLVTADLRNCDIQLAAVGDASKGSLITNDLLNTRLTENHETMGIFACFDSTGLTGL